MPDPPQQGQATPQQPQTLAGMVRAKYPGAYDDLDDATLEKQVLAKYPQYSDLPRSQPQQQAQGFDVNAARQAGYSDDEILQHLTQTRNFDVQGALNAGYQKSEIIDHLSQSQPAQQQGTPITDKTTMQAQPTGVLPWLKNLEGDIRYGTGNTAPGRLLRALGAQGVNQGSQAQAGNFMASPLLGTTRAAQGVAELPSQPWQGTKDIVGGALDAAQIPSAFIGGEALESGAQGAAAATSKIFGNVQKAGQLFNEVKAASGGQPIEITNAMSQAASRAQDLANAGAKGMPRVISRFVARVTDPDKAPIAWDEARDFYSNVSRLSANEYQSMNPQMAAQVGKFAGAFDDALRTTATAAGKGDEYDQAMQLYRTAKSWQRFGANTWQGAKGALPWVGASAAGAYGARKIVDAVK